MSGCKRCHLPAHERNPGKACRLGSIVCAPAMAGSAGISKVAVHASSGRRSPKRSSAHGRPYTEKDILAVYIDGIEIAGHHVLAAVGLDEHGAKHLLGVVRGSSENARVVKDLLDSLVRRGIDARRQRLFIIDGSKAIRSAIAAVYGDQGAVQRCRAHKVRNVTERLPEPVRTQVKAVMHAAHKLPEKEGMAKLRQQAKWLAIEHPDAAATCWRAWRRPSQESTATHAGVDRCMSSTNILENPTVRCVV